MDNRPIGIFDSGVGGLSILQEVSSLLPKESIIYLADQKNVPYGGKTPEQIKEMARKAAEFLSSHDVKAIVVGCNSATVYALDYLRSLFDVPIVGTTPVVKTLSEKTKTGKVAVLSTPATAKSPYLADLIKKYASDKKVYIVGESGFELLVEKGDLENEKIVNAVNKHLLPLVEKGVDAIALGCTHYPFLKETIKSVVGDRVGIYDSGPAIARQLKRVLENENNLSNGQASYHFYTTGDAKEFKKIGERLLNTSLAHVDTAEYN